MDLVRRGNNIHLDLNDDQAIGLAAVLSNQQLQATPEQWAQGQMVYAWFFENIQSMAANVRMTRK